MAYIESLFIDGFKGFKNFKVENLGKLNIIIGDNNVGKSSFLEAALISNDVEDNSRVLSQIANYRNSNSQNSPNYSPFFSNSRSDRHIKVIKKFLEDDKEHKIEIIEAPLFKLFGIAELGNSISQEASMVKLLSGSNLNEKDNYCYVKYNDNPKSIFSNTKSESGYIHYIHAGIFYNSDLVSFYSQFIKEDKDNESKLIRVLNEVFGDVERIGIDAKDSLNPGIYLFTKSSDKATPLSHFGDGFVKMFRFILEIFISRNSTLMVDEIDTGIYYKKYKGLWRVIFNGLKSNNCQIFATTHSLECLSSLREFLDENAEFQDGLKVINLRKDIDSYPFPVSYNFMEFKELLDDGNEIRL